MFNIPVSSLLYFFISRCNKCFEMVKGLNYQQASSAPWALWMRNHAAVTDEVWGLVCPTEIFTPFPEKVCDLDQNICCSKASISF